MSAASTTSSPDGLLNIFRKPLPAFFCARPLSTISHISTLTVSLVTIGLNDVIEIKEVPKLKAGPLIIKCLLPTCVYVDYMPGVGPLLRPKLLKQGNTDYAHVTTQH